MKILGVKFSLLCDCGKKIVDDGKFGTLKTKIEAHIITCECGTKFFAHVQEVKSK